MGKDKQDVNYRTLSKERRSVTAPMLKREKNMKRS